MGKPTTGADSPGSEATGAGALENAELRELWHELEGQRVAGDGEPEAMWIAVAVDLTDATGPFLSDHAHALEVCTKLSLEFDTTWVPVRFTPAGRVRGGQLEVERSGRDGEAGRTRQTGGYL